MTMPVLTVKPNGFLPKFTQAASKKSPISPQALPQAGLLCVLPKRTDYIYASVGVHPSDAVRDMQNADWLEQLEGLYSSCEKVVAIGEIGLDYHYGKEDKEEQKLCFDAQMQLAAKLDAPVVIHDREAHEDTLEILARYPSVTGVVHSFSGSFEMAKQVMKMGCYISVNGVLTFNNAKKIVDIVTRLDELAPNARERILMETDCRILRRFPSAAS